MAIGAHSSVTAAGVARLSTISCILTVPSSSPRVAVTMWVTGFSATMTCSQPGIVAGSTYTLDANVSGMMTSQLSVSTVDGERTQSATAVKIQPIPNAKTLSSRIDAMTPASPVCGRYPSIRPISTTITADTV